MSKTTIPVCLLAAAIAVAACDKSKTDKPAETAKPVAPAEPAKPADDKPMRVPPAATSAEALGTLPEGVGIAVGEKAPAVTATDLEGEPVELATINADGPVLLVFYRGGWCPFCNAQIHALTEAYPEFEKRGVTPVAISVNTPDQASKTSAAYEIPFPVLSDPDLAVHEAFKVVHHADAEEVKKLASFGIELEQWSGRDHNKFAIASIFLIDKDGTVKWAHADDDYKVRPSTEQLLAMLDDNGLAPE